MAKDVWEELSKPEVIEWRKGKEEKDESSSEGSIKKVWGGDFAGWGED